MKSLVIDQSASILGFAVVKEDPNTPIKYGVFGRLLHHGRIKTNPKQYLLDRLMIIRADIEALIKRHNPDEIVMENTQFIQRSSDGAGATGAVVRVIKDLCKAYGINYYFQHPNTIKKGVTGNGKADKEQMIKAAMDLWHLGRYKIQDDNHADALCAAFVWLVNGDDIREKKRASKK